jgi:hypothetical protein
MTPTLANVRFLSRDEGGRHQPPDGATYSTVARFQTPSGVDQSWSVVLEFIGTPKFGEFTVTQVRFLSPAAPAQLLSSGRGFELIEGPRVVANALVVSAPQRRLRDAAVGSPRYLEEVNA